MAFHSIHKSTCSFQVIHPLYGMAAWSQLFNALTTLGFPHSSDGKESASNVGGLGLIPGWGRSLEKRMATQSSILAWRIPWTEESGGLLSMELQRVRHD